MREQDYGGRWGGEEFILMFPETPLEPAVTVAEKIRKTIAGHVFSYEDITLAVTMTFGVTCYHPGMKIDDCLKKADMAMYQGKEVGRNCVKMVK